MAIFNKLLLTSFLWYIVDSSCDATHFPVTEDQRLQNLVNRDADSYDECAIACCDETDFYCIVFQWCPEDTDGSCFKGECWIGDHIQIHGSQQTGWEGASRQSDPTLEPTTSPSTIKTGSDAMSGGVIFIVALSSLLVLYCIIGCLYNGHKNKNWRNIKNNIPNYTTWQSLPKLTIVGCKVSYEWIMGKMGRAHDQTDALIEVVPTD